jgi:glutamate carboxypeptidase
MSSLLEYVQATIPALLADLETLVRLESPSRDVAAINAVQDQLATWLAPFGTLERYSCDLGDVLHLTVAGERNERLLLLAHADTVYAHGAWSQNWWRDASDGRDKAYGPGVYDMKGGIIQALYALKALAERGQKPNCTVELLITPDEEIESRAGRPFIEARATGARGVIVLEPPHLNGDLKIARKGVGTYRLSIGGKAAHQGTEPENGINAVVAAAALISQIVTFQDLAKGTTLGPNVIRGGTVSNVVPDLVELEVDIRVWTVEEGERVEAAMRALQPILGATLTIKDGLNRPAMEPTSGSMALLALAQELAAGLGFHPGAARVGGGSDGNFTAKLAPTLDGFGAHGANAHQREREHVLVGELAQRTALLAELMLRA